MFGSQTYIEKKFKTITENAKILKVQFRFFLFGDWDNDYLKVSANGITVFELRISKS